MSTDLTPRGGNDDRGAPDDPDRNRPHRTSSPPSGRRPLPGPRSGLEEHLPRLSDVDEKAGDRQARIVATFFGWCRSWPSSFVVIYFAVPKEAYIDFGPLHSNAQNVGFGLTLGLALLFIGLGAVQWARQLMYDGEMIDYRHPVASPEEDRQAIVATLEEGITESGVTRRKVLSPQPPRRVVSSPCPPSCCSPISVRGRRAAGSRRRSPRPSGPRGSGWSTM